MRNLGDKDKDNTALGRPPLWNARLLLQARSAAAPTAAMLDWPPDMQRQDRSTVAEGTRVPAAGSLPAILVTEPHEADQRRMGGNPDAAREGMGYPRPLPGKPAGAAGTLRRHKA